MTIVLAHRGDHHDHAENTLAAFSSAVARGADGVELDVRHTGDDVLVVHRDGEIPGLGLVERMTAADLPDWVPTLAAVLDACRGSLVNVEVKRASLPTGGPGTFPSAGDHAGDRTATLLVTLLRARRVADKAAGTAPDRVVVSSFALEPLDVVVAGGGIETAWLVPPLRGAADLAGAAAERGYGGLHPSHEQLPPALVERAHELGLAVRIWTVNDPARARLVADLGVDAIITDEVDLVRAALA